MFTKLLSHKRIYLTVRPFSVIREIFRKGYTSQMFLKDIFAGLTVGIIAIPLSMALAIASGVPPQHGLYTAIIAGIVIALAGGSRFSISGPTAAFVVILFPVTQEFGLSGLLMATLLSGIILLLMSIFRLGRLIEYIPLPVTLGFTGGIGIVIATLQIKDFLGLTITEMPENYIGKVETIISALPTTQWASALVGIITLIVLTQWKRLKLSLPGHLPAVIIATIASVTLSYFGHDVATIGSAFQYILPDGTTGYGIPNTLPEFTFPWNIPNADGSFTTWDFETIQALLPVAFSMAVLGAIESLLCAVVLDNMTNTKHYSNNELLAQGLGNIIAPFFGGITATAAIARSVANLKAGGVSPISSVVHALLVLLSILLLAGLLSYLPLASMAALLLVVAWNMANVSEVISQIKRSSNSEIAILLICITLTVIFDMVIAITVGVLIACLFFIRSIAKMTKAVEMETPENIHHTKLYRINGPLFFAAADNLFSNLYDRLLHIEGLENIVLECDVVTILDTGGIHAISKFIKHLAPGQTLYMCNIQEQPLKMVMKSKKLKEMQSIVFMRNVNEAFEHITTTSQQEKSKKEAINPPVESEEIKSSQSEVEDPEVTTSSTQI